VASIKKRPNGKWRARYRDDTGRERAGHFETKAKARAWLDEQTAALVTGQYVDPAAGKITFGEYFRDWASRQVWESTTERSMLLAANTVTFGDVQLRSLRRSHIEQWIKAMQTKDRGDGKPLGLAPGTIRTRVMHIRTVLRAAVRDRRLVSDPSDGVNLPRVRRAEVAMTIPTPAHVKALLEGADDEFAAFIAVCAFAGLRLGEAAGLKVSDINFLRRELAVTRQVQKLPGGKVEIRAPKYGSERTVYLADGLLAILAEHVARVAGDEPEAWLFPRYNEPGYGRRAGEFAGRSLPWHQNTVGYRWRKACKVAGVTGFTLHDLRHFFASGLIAQGCDVVTVQRALGHANATVTLTTYSHLWPSAADRTRKAAAAMMAEALIGDGSPADSARTEGQ
jgi:integrase